MKIPVVFSHYNEGCAATYTISALQRMGYETARMSPEDYFVADPEEYDLFFCQDSGEGVDFARAKPETLRKTSMWYWDSAWNHSQRKQWGIGDDDMGEIICRNGGWVFHAWQSDLDRFHRSLYTRSCSSLLPVAGDPIQWPDEPKEEKIWPMAFVGNCYDQGRAGLISYSRDRAGLQWPGPNQAFFGNAARIYRQAWAVFHPPTFYQFPHDYIHERVDLMQGATMRHYEALCCGVPLVTTHKPDFEMLGFEEGVHVFTYENKEDVPTTATRAIEAAKVGGDAYAKKLRQFILDKHTYEHRMIQALDVLKNAGVV